MNEPVTIGSRRELAVDRFLWERLDQVAIRLHPPVPAGTALRFDRPWEGVTSTYVTVLPADDGFFMVYRGSPAAGEPEVTCIAESADGVTWRRPDLSLFPLPDHPRNNVIWAGEGAHNLAPFLDTNPAAPVAQRYRALAGRPPLALVSPDGVHWRRLSEEPLWTEGRFDSQNVAFWDGERNCYAAYVRIWRDDIRWLARSESADFLHWSPPEPVEVLGAKETHFYTNVVQPYGRAPHLLLALPNRFIPDRKPLVSSPLDGVSDTLLLSSRDGRRFEWVGQEAYIRPGLDANNWGDRSNMAVVGMIQTKPGELSLYVGRGYRSQEARIERYTVRLDGMSSLHATTRPGELLSKPLIYDGDTLTLNVSTSAAGQVQVEVQDPDGAPLPGLALGQCRPVVGDDLERPVRWESDADLGAHAGRPVRLRLVMQEADLYSWRFHTV